MVFEDSNMDQHSTEKPKVSDEEIVAALPKLIEDLNARLLEARTQGASCIVLGASDDFVLFHPDETRRPLPSRCTSETHRKRIAFR